MPDIPTSLGPVPTRVLGPEDAPAVVFVHGVVVDSALWDGVASRLAERHRVVLPDLPLGAHARPVPDRSRLTLAGVARAVVDVLDHLGLEQAVIVGNDTGGAISQVLAATAPERVRALVLTSSDAFSNCPPWAFVPVQRLLALPGAERALQRALRSDRFVRSPIVYGLLTRDRLPQELLERWMGPPRRDVAVAGDLAAILRSLHRSATQQAAAALAARPVPLLLAWSRRDLVFPPRHARRLAAMVPGARLTWIERARTFSPIDQPHQVATGIDEFLGALAVAQP